MRDDNLYKYMYYFIRNAVRHAGINKSKLDDADVVEDKITII